MAHAITVLWSVKNLGKSSQKLRPRYKPKTAHEAALPHTPTNENGIFMFRDKRQVYGQD
jgi:hypothetical protein